jgi:putative transposase
MAAHPREYRLSSYRCNAEGKASDLITPHREYLRLAKEPAERQAAYRALFRGELDPETMKEIREATNGGYALGGKRFLAQTEAAAGRRVTRGKAGRPAASTDAVPAEHAKLF